MKFFYSELVERFKDVLGTPKEEMEEAFNKPDATDVLGTKCISVKDFGGYCILIIFEMGDTDIKILNAYRVYPELMDGFSIAGARPLAILEGFMDRYGIAKEIPGFGEHKFFVKKEMRIMFLGILDIEKYLEVLEAVKSRGLTTSIT